MTLAALSDWERYQKVPLGFGIVAIVAPGVNTVPVIFGCVVRERLRLPRKVR